MRPDDLAELVVGTIKAALAPVRADVARLEGRLEAASAPLAALDALRSELAAARERIATLEARAPVPGPPGRDGDNGLDGLNGFGFDDLEASFDGDRTIALTFTRGPLVKTFPIVLPIPRYQGIYLAGVTYTPGDVVTWSGSAWHCKHATSSRPGEAPAAWQLMVKAGRDLRPERRAS
jgi:hypothetical protein